MDGSKYEIEQSGWVSIIRSVWQFLLRVNTHVFAKCTTIDKTYKGISTMYLWIRTTTGHQNNGTCFHNGIYIPSRSVYLIVGHRNKCFPVCICCGVITMPHWGSIKSCLIFFNNPYVHRKQLWYLWNGTDDNCWSSRRMESRVQMGTMICPVINRL